MANRQCHDLLAKYTAAVELVTETIGGGDNERWLRGLDPFQVPCKIAYHIVECLDDYLRDPPEASFEWGSRFGGGWWKRADAAQPTQGDLLSCLSDIGRRICRHLTALDDEQLFSPFDESREHDEACLGHCVYARRHALHDIHRALSSRCSRPATGTGQPRGNECRREGIPDVCTEGQRWLGSRMSATPS